MGLPFGISPGASLMYVVGGGAVILFLRAGAGASDVDDGVCGVPDTDL